MKTGTGNRNKGRAVIKSGVCLLTLCITMITAGCGGQSINLPAGAPAIAFASDRMDYEGPESRWSHFAPEIYIMNPDGSNVRKLTETFGPEKTPVWSLDGSKIAFEWDNFKKEDKNSIYVMDANGKNRVRLTGKDTQDHCPSWSPDGRQIVFHTYQDGNPEIYLMDADGNNQARLTEHPGVDWVPAWSPDGHHIAFVSYRDGNSEIFVMDTTGENPVNLTRNPARDTSPA